TEPAWGRRPGSMGADRRYAANRGAAGRPRLPGDKGRPALRGVMALYPRCRRSRNTGFSTRWREARRRRTGRRTDPNLDSTTSFLLEAPCLLPIMEGA